MCVSLALKNNQLNVAKDYANKSTDDEKKTGLWMKIAQSMMERGENIKEVVQLTRETDSLGIEHILPNLHGNVKMDYFKTELCESLRDKNDRIQKLKSEMDSYRGSAYNLKYEFKSMTNSFMSVAQAQKCLDCNFLLYLEEYIVFPCLHCYHKVIYKLYCRIASMKLLRKFVPRMIN